MHTHLTTQCSQCVALTQEIAHLRTELDKADRDPVWGILTRVGLERRMPKPGDGTAAIVLDVDHMDAFNDRYGHDGLDMRMSDALQVYRDGAIVAGRWQHGDEVVAFAPMGDALGLALRLQAELARQGLSATFAVVWAADHTAIVRGQRRIERAKREGMRGRVFVVAS